MVEAACERVMELTMKQVSMKTAPLLVTMQVEPGTEAVRVEACPRGAPLLLGAVEVLGTGSAHTVAVASSSQMVWAAGPVEREAHARRR